MMWAVAIAFLALMLLWIVFGFVGELLAYRIKQLERQGRERWPPRS